MLVKLSAWLEALRSDRGEGPIPYVVLVAIMAAVASAVAGGIWLVADQWILDLQSVDSPR